MSKELLDLIEQEKIRRECERSFSAFVRHAWQVLEPGVPYLHNWHIDVLCEHLEAVSRGEIKRLLINVPPRMSKSTLVSVLWPCWVWISAPYKKFMCASHGTSLSVRDNVNSRRLIGSDWYQSKWGDRFKMSSVQDAKVKYENDKSGYRIATSVGSGVTGQGANFLVCLHPDTKIMCSDGEYKIGEIVNNEIDKTIIGFCHKTNKTVQCKIERFEKSEGRKSFKLKTNGGVEIIATHDHPIYVVGKGYIPLEEVEVNDTLVSNVQRRIRKEMGWLKSFNLIKDFVKSIEEVETPEFVYNVAVRDTHNYFANGILLHNCDDPHDAGDAQSDALRETAAEWWNNTWSTRLNNPKEDAMIVIMQRLHESDISGIILEQGGWEHVCIPAEYDNVVRSTCLGTYDPRTKEGELLWPERVGEEELASLKKQFGEYGTAGQLQQAPAPLGGGMLKTDWFELWPNDKPIPQLEYIVQSYDTAFTEKTTGDPTACTVWGVFHHRGEFNAMLLDCWSERLSYPDLRERMLKDWNAQYAGDKIDPINRARRANLVLIEEKGSGQSLIQDLRKARIAVAPYNPGRVDKVARATVISPLLEAGLVWLPESKQGGKWVTWADEFMRQVARFPRAAHDDYIDTMTQCLRLLRDKGFLGLAETRRKDEEVEQYKPEFVNPYAV